MQLVLEFARATDGQTSPNPAVACVIVKDGQIIGIGAHLKAGSEHAEIHALNMAKDNATDATLYVNLEPCCHTGRTPPCVDAIIAAKIKQVVIANRDPNPQVDGRGIAALKNAGIEVICGVMAPEAAQLNQKFFHATQNDTPYVTIKVGMSLDGKICSSDQNSKWITGAAARLDAHTHYRHTHDAILIGVGTAIMDNPSLTTRLQDSDGKNPIRIVLDSGLNTPANSKLLTDNQAPTWILTTTEDADKIAHYQAIGRAQIIKLDTLEPQFVLKEMKARGINSILVEGGAAIYASFIEAKAFNQIVTYINPRLIGGAIDALQFFGGKGFYSLEDSLKLDIIETTKLGSDLKIVLVPLKA